MHNTKKILFSFVSILCGLVVALLIAEALLRVVHIPGIEFGTRRYDSLTGVSHYPNSTLVYRGVKGDFVKRRINSYGYADSEHERDKRKGVFRIGFFGDSFTEAGQVPLEDTFFKIIEKNVKDHNVECLAFGVTGFSTLQSYITYKKCVKQFDLDLVVYVFYGNDPREETKELNDSPDVPFPVLVNGKLQIDNSFRARNCIKESAYYQIGKYLTAHSMVAATIAKRIKLLQKYGVKFIYPEEERLLALKPDPNNDASFDLPYLPSSYPDHLRDHVIDLESAVISEWHRDAERQECKFAILYIPFYFEIKDKIKPEDTWRSWISSFSESQNIPFIDLTDHFSDMEKSGRRMFYDHFTKVGHLACAEVFLEWFINWVPRPE